MIWIETIIQRYSGSIETQDTLLSLETILGKTFNWYQEKGGSKYTFPKSVTARTCFLYHLSSDFQKQNVLPKVSSFIDRKLLQLENYNPFRFLPDEGVDKNYDEYISSFLHT